MSAGDPSRVQGRYIDGPDWSDNCSSTSAMLVGARLGLAVATLWRQWHQKPQADSPSVPKFTTNLRCSVPYSQPGQAFTTFSIPVPYHRIPYPHLSHLQEDECSDCHLSIPSPPNHPKLICTSPKQVDAMLLSSLTALNTQPIENH